MLPDETGSAFKAKGLHALAITDGEVNFLWWFIQGSIMNPETWEKLTRGGGFCERHAWVHLSIEIAFRQQYLLGPAILYRALIEQALRAFDAPQRISAARLVRRLKPGGPCFLCDMKLHAASAGVSPQKRLDQGRNLGALRTFAAELEPLWRDSICGSCGKVRNELPGGKRCRRHLLFDVRAGRQVDLRAQQVTLKELALQLDRYEHSFSWDRRALASQVDRASLISAIGWCSSWRPLLALLG